jgi:hypothetical protein
MQPLPLCCAHVGMAKLMVIINVAKPTSHAERKLVVFIVGMIASSAFSISADALRSTYHRVICGTAAPCARTCSQPNRDRFSGKNGLKWANRITTQ